MIWRAVGAAALGVLATAAASPLFAAGFGLFEQGAKASGMGGAFTAQADDPSALFFNAGGVAFFDHTAYQIGGTYIYEANASFKGANPFPGVGYSADRKTLSTGFPHLYWVQPINSTWKFGLGIESPFGLTTEWKNPDQFAGRFLSTKASLLDIDINPTIGWQITPTFGIGAGFVARFSTIELDRNAPAINPFTLSTIDVAHVKLKGDVSEGYGFNVGILNRYNNSFSWGLSYRSPITVNYSGHADLSQISTGNAGLDAVIAARTPFGRHSVKTSLKYPDLASLGLAFALTSNLVLETDVNWAGWTHFKEVPITFTDGKLPNSTIIERWKDSWNYRAGLRWTTSPAWQWRLGYIFDKNPQPEQTVNPLLPDADRNGFTVGVGHHGGKFSTDLAVLYIAFKDRTRAKSFADDPQGPFFGTYMTKAWLVDLSVGF
ncbi:MAG TPA: outer membrane protein transport protein [Thermoanaerobaculia bacterium]|nr:outer membrane protein transport protein [Thermoanaerobaculia bacterium]